MNHTHVRPARDLRNNYKEIVEIVKGNQDHVVITNQGKGDIVLMDFAVFSEFEEYLHSRYIKRKLEEAKQAMADPGTRYLSQEEFWAEIGL